MKGKRTSWLPADPGVVRSVWGAKGREKGAGEENVPEFVLTYAENQAEDYPTTQGAYRFADW